MKNISSRKLSKSGIGLVLTVVVLLAVLPVFHISMSHRSDLPLLFGDRNEALLDLWSIQHFCSGILIGSFLTYLGITAKVTWQRFALFILVLTLSWEALELAMESGLFGQAVANWKHGFEHWANRFIGDPVMVLLGGLVARRFKSSWKIAMLPCIAWLIVNIASPHSMSIQQLVFGP